MHSKLVRLVIKPDLGIADHDCDRCKEFRPGVARFNGALIMSFLCQVCEPVRYDRVYAESNREQFEKPNEINEKLWDSFERSEAWTSKELPLG